VRNLLKLAPSVATEKVMIGGEEIEIGGISADAIAALAVRFPQIATVLTKAQQSQGIEWGEVLPILGDAVGPLIAAGCGELGDVEAEAVASRLAFPLQAQLAVPILKRTFPDGIGPFVAWVTGEIEAIAKTAPMAAPARGIRIRSRKSPPPSGNSHHASDGAMPGP
jgi:hypothetical protein